jgi:hypothetical protein
MIPGNLCGSRLSEASLILGNGSRVKLISRKVRRSMERGKPSVPVLLYPRCSDVVFGCEPPRAQARVASSIRNRRRLRTSRIPIPTKQHLELQQILDASDERSSARGGTAVVTLRHEGPDHSGRAAFRWTRDRCAAPISHELHLRPVSAPKQVAIDQEPPETEVMVMPFLRT